MLKKINVAERHDAGDDEDEGTPVSVKIRERLLAARKRFHANDNIAEFIEPGELETLLDEVEVKMKAVLESLVIDIENTHGALAQVAAAISDAGVNIAAATSRVSKGESLVDTVKTVEALGAEILVMRHAVSGAPYLAAEIFGGSVVNGGDGWHAHPTQALLDLYTMRAHLDGSVEGRKVVILGDILHSRVARSNIWTLTAAGADVWLCGPATLLRGFEAWGLRGAADGRRFHVTSSLEEGVRDADVVMALRIQKERMSSGLLPSLREYAARYGLTRDRLALARPDALVMHPGPMNRGVEIDSAVADDLQRSVIHEQVEMGVAVRMACLDALVGGLRNYDDRLANDRDAR